MNVPPDTPSPLRPIRWWPALIVLMLILAGAIWVRTRDDLYFQQKNIITAQIVMGGGLLLLLWWIFLSRAPKRLRQLVAVGVLLAMLTVGALFRIRGVSGDLVPILEPRWANRELPKPEATLIQEAMPISMMMLRDDFPQFLGPQRNAILTNVKLNPDWAAQPPEIVWKQKIGAAWSGFSLVAGRAYTQEQRGADECVTCYDAQTGKLLWVHADATRYFTTIAGEGPRATPTVSEGKVFTFGATGRLNCLEAATGKVLWTQDTAKLASAKLPDWGFTSSPLVLGERVIVSVGGTKQKSLLAFHRDTGELLWSAGDAEASYSSPALATLAGVPQVLIFNSGFIAAHVPESGKILWEYPWGIGYPHVAMPIPVGTNRVLFTSGYGVGTELLEIAPRANGSLAASAVWKSKRLKAKFSNPVLRDGFVYGLDDGIFACLDVTDGALKWKEGRYGHGQGLLLGEHFLLMAESGELVLLRPTPEAPNELARFRVFNDKTWNPIALSGDLLFVRNDQEAACVRLKLAR